MAAQKAGEAIRAREDAGAPPEKIYVRDIVYVAVLMLLDLLSAGKSPVEIFGN